jgi:superfamily I DNA/RNA helicase
VERLQQAADRRVGKNSEELADLLTAKALKGKLANTRFLVGLAEGKKPSETPNKKRRGPSEAQRLAMESEWSEPSEPDEEDLHPVWVDKKREQTSEGGLGTE